MTMRRDSLLRMIAGLELDGKLQLYSKTGKPTKETRTVDGGEWWVNVNLTPGFRDVVACSKDAHLQPKLDCERFGWEEIGKAVGAEWLRREDAKRHA